MFFFLPVVIIMEFDWSKCIICQKDTNEHLRCPLYTLRLVDPTNVYKSFLDNVQHFRAIDALPVRLYFDADETAENFASHSASWHKSCHSKFNKTKLERARKAEKRHSTDITERRLSKRQAFDAEKCVLCVKGVEEGVLHEVQMFKQDTKIRNMATELNDTEILSRISCGDMIASEAKYHLSCLTKLRNRYRTFIRKQNKTEENTDNKMNECRAFIELIRYMEECVIGGTFLFKLNEMHSLYVERLKDLGIRKTINKSRLKAKILEAFPLVQEQSHGQNIVFVFEEGMRSMLTDALIIRDFSEDALILSKAAAIIRNDMFNHTGFKFTGSFSEGCQESSVPASLKLILSMILNGATLKDQSKSDSQACLTIGQMIFFNTKKKASNAVKTRHVLEREPPLPVYIGMCVHSRSRNKTLIQQLHKMGLSISYDRVIQLEDQMAISACERFKEDHVVTPACLRKGLFTVGALDNLDHNPSSTTSSASFHGTGISLFQIPKESQKGERRPPLKIPPSSNMQSLPDEYAFVPAVALQISTVEVPECRVSAPQKCLDEAKHEEEQWSQNALSLLSCDTLTKETNIAWSSYHASLQSQVENNPALHALLPLFYEKSATPAMIKHGMNVVKNATDFLNPGQIPITTFDQPLFAIAKFVQWKWPNTHGEKMHVVMLGGLHTEMALWNTLGDLLDGSGWTTALAEAGVASAGTADSYLKVTHLTRTRHAHQVTLLTLRKLLKEAFLNSEGSADADAFMAWRKSMAETYPTFKFWDLIERLETVILIFCRAHRQKNFPLYVEALEELIPFFFAMDHTNYARWASVHMRDMKSLPESTKEEFIRNGKWVVSKTKNVFSSIPIDQAHEQENKVVKSSGGVLGITNNPSTLRRWMLSGPEIGRCVNEFQNEYMYFNEDEEHQNTHHEQAHSTQTTFQKQVINLTDTINRMGNPFLDDFQDLVNLENRNCLDESAVMDLNVLETTGKEQYNHFVKTVFEDRSHSIHEPIKKNSLAVFKKKHRITSQQGKKVKILQNNVALFGQLYVATQSRDGDLDEFFAHEIQSFPPSLSDFGKLHLPSKKSDLLEQLCRTDETEHPPAFDCKVLDGAVTAHSLPTSAVSTFNEYADKVFLPYLERQLQTSSRIDVVWDKYVSDSLKECTREKRGKGNRRKVSGGAKIPGKWADFLRDPLNKTELFAFLSSKIETHCWPLGKSIHVTKGNAVVSLGTSNPMQYCNHEEADTRIVIHVMHSLNFGAQTVQVRTIDTDVIVILVGVFHDILAKYPIADIWVAFGMGKKYRMYHINSICEHLGEERSRALPIFHAFTGCDTTSAFRGKGKKSAWQTWSIDKDITDTFLNFACHPFQQVDVESDYFKKIERFTIVLYDRTSHLTSVNECRRVLFCQMNRSMDNLPPTRNSLLQHTRRAVYQAGIWTTCTQPQPQIPSPQDFAWTKTSETWKPVWMTIPEVSKSCRELIKCSCKGECTMCKCAKAQVVCSPLCKCKCTQ